MTGDRDRDAARRPRQARPRDALGRPLPYGSVGVEPVSEEPLPPAQTLVSARSLVEAGRPFAAHEVLEARWKAGPEQVVADVQKVRASGLIKERINVSYAVDDQPSDDTLIRQAVADLDRSDRQWQEWARATGASSYPVPLLAIQVPDRMSPAKIGEIVQTLTEASDAFDDADSVAHAFGVHARAGAWACCRRDPFILRDVGLQVLPRQRDRHIFPWRRPADDSRVIPAPKKGRSTMGLHQGVVLRQVRAAPGCRTAR